MKLSEIRQRLDNNYVFGKAGDVVISQSDDMAWLLDKVAQLEAELENTKKDLSDSSAEIVLNHTEIENLRAERDALSIEDAMKLSEITDLNKEADSLIMKYVYPSGMLIMGEFIYQLEAKAKRGSEIQT